MQDNLIIDGSMGEGGGQVLRTSLGLAVLTGRPIVVENIRAGRKKPGLLRQHLACVKACARVGAAEVVGAEISSQRIEFRPQAILPGSYEFAINGAGSTNLVFQSVMPALLAADGPSTVVIRGGTHNPLAPCFDYLERVFFRVLRQMGVVIEAKIHGYGFFPIGGGCIEIRIEPPAQLTPFEILERGEVKERGGRVLIAGLGAQIAEREVFVIMKRLGWRRDSLEIRGIGNSASPGNAVILEVESEHIREQVVSFGTKSRRAEVVAKGACLAMESYLRQEAPVGVHLADQLLIPMALAGGGAFRCGTPSLHTLTNAEVISKFLDVEFEFTEEAAGTHVIELKT